MYLLLSIISFLVKSVVNNIYKGNRTMQTEINEFDVFDEFDIEEFERLHPRAGQVRKIQNKDIYIVVTRNFDRNVSYLYPSGEAVTDDISNFPISDVVKCYDSWQEAVNDEHFC